MHLQVLGAARTVTGSMHLLEVNGARILLDCGLYQGPRKEAFERNRVLPLDPATIHNVILSHAHIDHSGNLPQLTRGRFQGKIISTSATRDLCEWMLRDSASVSGPSVCRVLGPKISRNSGLASQSASAQSTKRVCRCSRNPVSDLARAITSANTPERI